jgi:chromosomal replication initiation ATPase DnaA
MFKLAVVQIDTGWAEPEIHPVHQQAWLVQETVAHVTGVPLKDLCAKTRSRPKAAFARQIAMYLTHTVFEISLTNVAVAFSRDRSTAAHAIHRIEDLREDPELDRLLVWLETMLSRAGSLS